MCNPHLIRLLSVCLSDSNELCSIILFSLEGNVTCRWSQCSWSGAPNFARESSFVVGIVTRQARNWYWDAQWKKDSRRDISPSFLFTVYTRGRRSPAQFPTSYRRSAKKRDIMRDPVLQEVAHLWSDSDSDWHTPLYCCTCVLILQDVAHHAWLIDGSKMTRVVLAWLSRSQHYCIHW